MNLLDTLTSPYAWPVTPPPPVALERGTVLAERYVIDRLLGRGGNGTVFRAWDRLLSCAIAIKVLSAEQTSGEQAIRRLGREVRLSRGVRHPNVCQVFDLGSGSGQWFITMELACSATLGDELREGPDAPAGPDAWRCRAVDAHAVCAGLAAIHDAGIVHRDIKPQNVLRMPDGRLTIADFGMAQDLGAEPSLLGGTPNYLPPEVVLGLPSDQASDVWQLGVLMHHILLRRRPAWTSQGDRLPVPVPPTDATPARIAALLRISTACLAWHREARPANARHAFELLQQRT